MEICSHNVIRLLTPNRNRLSARNSEKRSLQSTRKTDFGFVDVTVKKVTEPFST